MASNSNSNFLESMKKLGLKEIKKRIVVKGKEMELCFVNGRLRGMWPVKPILDITEKIKQNSHVVAIKRALNDMKANIKTGESKDPASSGRTA